MAEASKTAVGMVVATASKVGTEINSRVDFEAIAENTTGKAVDDNDRDSFQSVKVLGQSSLAAGAELFGALFDATNQLVSTTTKVTTKALGHRYGEDVKKVAEDSAEAINNALAVKDNLSGHTVATAVVKENI